MCALTRDDIIKIAIALSARVQHFQGRGNKKDDEFAAQYDELHDYWLSTMVFPPEQNDEAQSQLNDFLYGEQA
jgi:hypothetical protein